MWSSGSLTTVVLSSSYVLVVEATISGPRCFDQCLVAIAVGCACGVGGPESVRM